MRRTDAITWNIPTTTISGCNTVLSSHGSTLTRDGGWYYVRTKKVAAALGALIRIWTFMSNRSLCQLHLKDVWMVSALYSVCAVYL